MKLIRVGMDFAEKKWMDVPRGQSLTEVFLYRALSAESTRRIARE